MTCATTTVLIVFIPSICTATTPYILSIHLSLIFRCSIRCIRKCQIHFFVLVQNFENNYIQFNQPFIQDKTHIQISGRLLIPDQKNNNIDGIDIYYDKTPTPSVYEQHKNDKSYGPGKVVASVFNPLDFNLWIVYIREYICSSIGIQPNITLIHADKWSIDGQTIDIRFDLSPILKKDGVYNIVTFLEDEQKNQFPVTSYSVFVRIILTSLLLVL